MFMDIASDIDVCQYGGMAQRDLQTLTILENCCPPLMEGRIDASDAERLATAFKVLGDPTRLRLLSMLAATPGGETCVCNLIEPLGLSQPTVSHHLKVLHQAGLVERERRGSWV